VVSFPDHAESEFSAEGEEAELVFDAQAFELESGANRHDDVLALGPIKCGLHNISC
jgi:hypothetical protein